MPVTRVYPTQISFVCLDPLNVRRLLSCSMYIRVHVAGRVCSPAFGISFRLHEIETRKPQRWTEKSETTRNRNAQDVHIWTLDRTPGLPPRFRHLFVVKSECTKQRLSTKTCFWDIPLTTFTFPGADLLPRMWIPTNVHSFLDPPAFFPSSSALVFSCKPVFRSFESNDFWFAKNERPFIGMNFWQHCGPTAVLLSVFMHLNAFQGGRLRSFLLVLLFFRVFHPTCLCRRHHRKVNAKLFLTTEKVDDGFVRLRINSMPTGRHVGGYFCSWHLFLAFILGRRFCSQMYMFSFLAFTSQRIMQTSKWAKSSSTPASECVRNVLSPMHL